MVDLDWGSVVGVGSRYLGQGLGRGSWAGALEAGSIGYGLMRYTLPKG